MADFTQEDVARVAAGMTKEEQAALTPFSPFSNAVHKSLIAKGLLRENDGVIVHTRLGELVRNHLKESTNAKS